MQHPFKNYLNSDQVDFGHYQHVCLFRDQEGVESATFVENLQQTATYGDSSKGALCAFYTLLFPRADSEQLLQQLVKLSQAVKANCPNEIRAASQEVITLMKEDNGVIDTMIGDVFMSGRLSAK